MEWLTVEGERSSGEARRGREPTAYSSRARQTRRHIYHHLNPLRNKMDLDAGHHTITFWLLSGLYRSMDGPSVVRATRRPPPLGRSSQLASCSPEPPSTPSPSRLRSFSHTMESLFFNVRWLASSLTVPMSRGEKRSRARTGRTSPPDLATSRAPAPLRSARIRDHDLWAR